MMVYDTNCLNSTRCREPECNVGECSKFNPAPSCSDPATGSDEDFIPFLERLTPKERKKFDKGMKRLRRNFRKRFKKFK